MPLVIDVPLFFVSPASGEHRCVPVQLGVNLSLRCGTVLGEYAARQGVYGPYDPLAWDGRSLARGILRTTCASDGQGAITLASLVPGRGLLADRTHDRVEVFVSGCFACEDLVGLDDAAARQLGRIVQGTSARGILIIP